MFSDSLHQSIAAKKKEKKKRRRNAKERQHLATSADIVDLTQRYGPSEERALTDGFPPLPPAPGRDPMLLREAPMPLRYGPSSFDGPGFSFITENDALLSGSIR